jgi:hypothetical protein
LKILLLVDRDLGACPVRADDRRLSPERFRHFDF